MRLLACCFLFVIASSAGPRETLAQRAGQPASVAQSGRAATAVCLSTRCRLTDTSTVTVLVEYGQPHARGREVFGTLVPLDSVWRLGANTATHLFTKVPLTLGGTTVPPGTYSLYLRATSSGAQLVVSDTTGQWGIPYNFPEKDRARIPMRSRDLNDPVESLVITLVPNAPPAAPNSGTLTIAWGKREFSVEWTAQPGSGRGRGSSDAPEAYNSPEVHTRTDNRR